MKDNILISQTKRLVQQRCFSPTEKWVIPCTKATTHQFILISYQHHESVAFSRTYPSVVLFEIDTIISSKGFSLLYYDRPIFHKWQVFELFFCRNFREKPLFRVFFHKFQQMIKTVSFETFFTNLKRVLSVIFLSVNIEKEVLMEFDLFLMMCNYIGTIAFAVSGAVKGFKKKLDILELVSSASLLLLVVASFVI